MIDFNELKLKEKLFEFITNNSQEEEYKEGISLFQRYIINQEYFINENTKKIKIFSKIYNNETLETEIFINYKDFTYEIACFHCKNKANLCSHIIASFLYFIENFKYSYKNKKIEITDLLKIKQSPENEKFKGYVIKENSIFPCVILKTEDKFLIKKYSKESEFDQLDEATVEFIISYQEQNPDYPIFFIPSKGKSLIPISVDPKEKIQLILNLERISDFEIKVKAEFTEPIFTTLKGFIKKYYIFKNGLVKTFSPKLNLEIVESLLFEEKVIDIESLNTIIFKEDEFKNKGIIINKNISGFNIITSSPEIKVFLETEKNFLIVKAKCIYNENLEIDLMTTKRIINDNIIFIHEKEKNFYYAIQNLKPFKSNSVFYFTKESAINFIGKVLYEKFPDVQIFGEEKLLKFKILKPKTKTIHIKSFSYDEWFGIDGWIDFEELRISLYDIIKAIKKGKKYVQVKKDVYAPIPEKIIKNIEKLLTQDYIVIDKKEKKLKSLKPNISVFDEFLQQLEVEVEYSKELKELKEKLKSFKKIKKYKFPEPLNSILRNYQKEGVNWLLFLRDYNLNGILADEMGLGKTIQALSLLTFEKDKKPNLIIVPTSLIYNWENEIKKFFYNFRYLIYYGKNREKFLKEIENFDIVLTTYNITRIDIDLLKEIQFNYIILDESQYIKNPMSMISRYLIKLKAKHKLALSGTPFENNLNELWSQFNFLAPSLLGDLSNFLKKYSVEQVKKKLKPLILRRKKDEVLDELPPKNEIIHFYEMNEDQRKFYDAIRTYYLEKIFNQINSIGINKSYTLIIEGLLRLRQACCHPILTKFEYENLKKIKSEKFENLKNLIIQLLEKDRKILIYSQFVEMLKIIKKWIKKEGIPFEYLDGTTKNRFEIVKNFQEDPNIKIFLLSIKAGGLGLNLTEADNVIIYDPWWNPAVEDQAIDRTHRIGQNKKVFVYKLIMKNSIEEKVLLLQNKKKKLFNDIFDTTDTRIKNLTKEDIEFLLSP